MNDAQLHGQNKATNNNSSELSKLISEAIENKNAAEKQPSRAPIDMKFGAELLPKAKPASAPMSSGTAGNSGGAKKSSAAGKGSARTKSGSAKGTSSAAEKAVKKKKKGWSTKKKTVVTLGVIFLALVIIMAIIVGLFFHYTGLLDRSGDTKINTEPAPIDSSELVDEEDTIDEQTLEEELKAQLAQSSTKISDEEVMNILLIGEDIRDTETSDRGNTDVMMIISINHEQKTITMTSLMRDMYIYMSQYYSSGKLNSAYWHGGAEYLEEVIEDYFGISIDRYVKVNFRQFIDIVEAVGGLDLTVAKNEAEAMDDPLAEQNKYLGYEKGTDYIDKSLYTTGEDDEEITMHLNGNQALAYARIRYNCGDDYGRTQRQRIVMQEIIKEAKKLSFIQLDELMNKVFPEVQTDITNGEIASLLLSAFDYMNYDIQQLRIPVDGYFTDEIINSQQVLSTNFQANAAILKYIVYGDQTNAEDAAAFYEEELANGNFYQYNQDLYR